MTTLMMMLPGVPCFYYGQEIGMMNNNLRSDQIRDLFVGRDPERLPMQWDGTLNAGILSDILLKYYSQSIASVDTFIY